MPVSQILAIGVGVSVVLGVLSAIGGWAWSSAHPTGRSRARIAGGCLGALIVNSWWVGFLGTAFWKIFILKQDP